MSREFGTAPFSMRSSAEMKADPSRSLLEDKPSLTLNGFYLRPKSKATVAITCADGSVPPKIKANWWQDPADRDAAVSMVKIARQFAAQPSLAKYIEVKRPPGPTVQNDEEIADALLWMISPGLHDAGTCRMGTSENSVADNRLGVHGIENLRVVDCSVMPTHLSGNTNGPAMVVAMRAAELILEAQGP